MAQSVLAKGYAVAVYMTTGEGIRERDHNPNILLQLDHCILKYSPPTIEDPVAQVVSSNVFGRLRTKPR